VAVPGLERAGRRKREGRSSIREGVSVEVVSAVTCLTFDEIGQSPTEIGKVVVQDAQ
jgi:hypothetical protein